MTIDPTLLPAGVNLATLPNDPSVLNLIPLTVGVMYVFQTPGLALDTHTHIDDNVHFSVVVSGSYTVVRQSTGTSTAVAGDLLDFAANDPHSITCVEPGTIVNVLKRGVALGTLNNELAKAVSTVEDLVTQTNALQAALAAVTVP